MIVTPKNTRDIFLQSYTTRTLSSSLTISEKPAIVAQYNNIVSTRTSLVSEADKFGISTEKSAYTTAITNLTTYLATLTSPVLWSDLSNITLVNRSDLDSKIASVTSAESTLRIAITSRSTIDAYITVPSISMTADSSGNVSGGVLAASGGTFKVLSGVLDISTGADIVYSVQSTIGCTVSINSSTGVYVPTGISQSNASAILRAQLPASYGSLVIDRSFALGKVNTGTAGAPGTPGASAKLMSISASSQIFSINKSNSSYPSSISLTAIRNNLTGATFSITSGSATLSSVSGDSATLTFGNMTSDTVTVKVTDDTNTYSDTITIVKVREGIDSLSAYLSNESVTVPADSSGTVTSYSGVGGNFVVYYGSTNVTTHCTFSVVSNPSSLTPSSSITAAGQYSISGGMNSLELAYVTYRATYTNAFGSVISIDKVFSISKSRTGTAGAPGTNGTNGTNGAPGTPGASAKLMSISASSQIFSINKSNSSYPSSISLTAIRNNLTGATFSITAGSATLTAVSGDSATLTFGNMTSDTVTVKVTDDTSTYSDTITIVKVREGIDSLSAYLSNESVTVPADSSGTVTSYSGVGGNFVVYYGSTNVTTQCTFSVVSNPSSLTPSSITTAGQYSISGGMNSLELAYITYRATYTNAFGSVISIDKVFSISKSRTGTAGAPGTNGTNGTNGAPGVQGPPGASSVVARAYQWSLSGAPTAVGTATFTWSSMTYNSVPSGWSVDKPPAPALGATLYEISVYITNTVAAATTSFNWATGSVGVVGYVGLNGANGANGTNGSNGAPGATGATGASAVIAYTLVDGQTLNSSPAFSTVGGNSLPNTGTWGETRAWVYSPATVSAGQSLFQSNGIYNPITNSTTWSLPYLSTLKVGTLSAITTNTGDLNVTGLFKSANGNFSVDASGNTTISSGTSGRRLVITNSGISVYDDNNVLRVYMGT